MIALQQFFKLRYLKRLLGLVVIIIVVVMIWGAKELKNKPLCPNCNVILVSLDTLSALHLPCYGYKRNTAPNLCAFAEKNIIFLNSFSHSPTTLNSHFSIFTSLYPHTHKMTEIFNNPLDEKYLTLTQIFRNNGYQTIYHGNLSDPHLPLDRGMERGFDIVQGSSFVDTWDQTYPELIKNNEEKKPTFLFLHTYAVHTPYLTDHKSKHLFTDLPEYPNIPLNSEEFRELSPELISFCADRISKNNNYLKDLDTLSTEVEIAAQLLTEKDYEKSLDLYRMFSNKIQDYCRLAWYTHKINLDASDPNLIEYVRALYDEQIYNLDKKLGGLFALIEDPKFSKNTILIITADHGEEFFEHGFFAHGNNLFKTSTLVPLIIYIPGVEKKEIKDIVQGIDIYPTALSLTGLKPESDIEGINLEKLIKGEKGAIKNKYLLSEYNNMVGVQDQNWRFYFNLKSNKPEGLYDLNADPEEQNNILSQNQKKLDSFTDILRNLNIP